MITRRLGQSWVQVCFVLALCAALYWPLLGTPGLGLSEGHRVVPAWHMLESGDWFRIEMFGATYLRKPPGFPWAIALSSMLLGETEFAARAVSAASCTLMAILALCFGRRWFASPGGWEGLAAGTAQAIMPQFVSIGRLAEIDAFNALGTQLACFGLIELVRARASGNTTAENELPPPRTGRGTTIGFAVLSALGIIIAGLAKGPASITCLFGVLLAASLTFGLRRIFRNVGIAAALFFAGSVLGLLAWMIVRANPAPDAVVQDFSEFTWSLDRLGATLGFIPSAWLAAMPASLSILPLVVLYRGGARAARSSPPGTPIPCAAGFSLAAMVALAWLLSVALLMLAGISNARYAMPAAVLLPPLAAFTLRLGRASTASTPTPLTTVARDVARWCYLHHPLVLPALFVPALLGWAVYRETYRDRREHGRAAGETLAKMVPDGAIVWANDLIEARPDVLLYMQRAARRDGGRTVEVRWERAAMLRAELPRPAGPSDTAPRFILLRHDTHTIETQSYSTLTNPSLSSPIGITTRTTARLIPRASGHAASYEFVLYEIVSDAAVETIPIH